MVEWEEQMVERGVGSVHDVGDARAPSGWAGTRPAERICALPQAFTSSAPRFVRPVHLKAGPVVGPQNRQLASTSRLEFGRCPTRASRGCFVSTEDALVR